MASRSSRVMWGKNYSCRGGAEDAEMNDGYYLNPKGDLKEKPQERVTDPPLRVSGLSKRHSTQMR